MGREMLIMAEDREKLAAPEQMRFRFVALCGATRHAAPQAAYREPPFADVLLERMGSHQSDILD
jgi:hypothetical protein